MLEKSSEDIKLEQHSVVRSLLVGSIAGGTEAFLVHPFVTTIFHKRVNKPLVYNFSNLYRGVSWAMLSRFPITAIQLATSQIIDDNFTSSIHDSTRRKLVSGFLGGLFSTVIAGPTELVTAHQYKFSGTFQKQFMHILKNKGLSGIFTGSPAVAIRVSGYTCSFYGIHPIIKKNIKNILDERCINKLNDIHGHELVQIDYVEKKRDPILSFFSINLLSIASTASIANFMATSIIAFAFVILSNPFDAAKTCQQNELLHKKLSLNEAAKHIYKHKGVIGFFHGLAPRGACVCIGIEVVTRMKTAMMPS